MSKREKQRALVAGLENDLWDWREECKITGKNLSKKLVQARARWAFQRAGLKDFKASDGWYWKWLSRCQKRPRVLKNREETDEGGANSGPLTQGEVSATGVSGSCKLSSSLASEARDYVSFLQRKHHFCPITLTPTESQSPIIPALSESAPSSTCSEAFPPLKRISDGFPAVPSYGSSFQALASEWQDRSDIDQMLDHHSLLFPGMTEEQVPALGEDIISHLSLDALTQQEESDGAKKQHVWVCSMPLFPDQTWDELLSKQTSSEECSMNIEQILDAVPFPAILSQDDELLLEEEATTPSSMQPLHGLSTSPTAFMLASPASIASSSGEQSLSPHSSQESWDDGLSSGCCSVSSPNSSNCSKESRLSVIAHHRILGPKFLNQLKERVREYAQNHTYKETAKKFGVHHSTVSGWVKTATFETKAPSLEKKPDQNSPSALGLDWGEEFDLHLADLALSSGLERHSVPNGNLIKRKSGVKTPPQLDEVFIQWLKKCRLADQVLSNHCVTQEIQNIIDQVHDSGALATLGEGDEPGKWFLLWKNRREEKLYVEGMEDELECKRETQNLSYPPAFKLEVALYASRHSQYAASKIFSVARRRIFDWMRQIPRLQDMVLHGHVKKITGRGPKNRTIDQLLYNWYCVNKAAGKRPKSSQVQAKAKEIFSAKGYTEMKCSYGWFKRWSQRFKIQLRYSYDDELLEWTWSQFEANASISHLDLQRFGLAIIGRDDASFKASSGWAMRFCKRHQNLLCPTLVSPSDWNELPSKMTESAQTFSASTIQLIQDQRLLSNQIGFMDEVSVHLNPQSLSKSVQSHPSSQLRESGFQGSSAVMILSALADGTLLTPMLILKTSKLGTAQSLLVRYKHILVLYQQVEPQRDIQVTEGTLCQWLSSVWFEEVPGSKLLILDDFQPHTSPPVKVAISAKKSHLALIPPSASLCSLPLLWGLNRRFKQCIEESYLGFLKEHHNSSSIKLKCLTSDARLIQWTNEAFQHISGNKDEIIAEFANSPVCQPSSLGSNAIHSGAQYINH